MPQGSHVGGVRAEQRASLLNRLVSGASSQGWCQPVLPFLIPIVFYLRVQLPLSDRCRLCRLAECCMPNASANFLLTSIFYLASFGFILLTKQGFGRNPAPFLKAMQIVRVSAAKIV
jgi:hypothetical protein